MNKNYGTHSHHFFFILRSCMDTKAKVTQYQIYVVDIVTKFYNNDKNWQIAATMTYRM